MIKPIPGIKIYGTVDKTCEITEAYHMITFFNSLRIKFPKSYGAIAVHIRNESQRTAQQAARHKMEGLVKGCADIIIPGNPSFVCEMKSRSPKAKITDKQINYLLAAQNNGSFVCVALGHEAAWEAFNEWRKLNDENKHKDTE